MDFGTRFRFKPIEPRRFFDAPTMIFVIGISALALLQIGLKLFGEPDLLTLMSARSGLMQDEKITTGQVHNRQPSRL